VPKGASRLGSSVGSYVRLFRLPGAAPLAFWGMVGRFPIAMRSISCLLLISAVTGSLTTAGTVAAAMLISQAMVSPLLGRLADRFSQRRVLLIACPVHAAGITLLLVSILLAAPLPVLVVLAAATGCGTVTYSSFMRARWGALVDAKRLRTAYAVESIVDEAIFLLGPLLVAVLVSTVHPAAGLVASVVLSTVGSIAVALHRRSEPAPEPAGDRVPERAIAVRGVQVLMVCYAGIGFLLGAVEVTMIAFAREQSTPGLGGVLVSLTAVGSLTAGAVYGAVDWRLSQVRLLSVTACLLTLGAIPLAYARSFLVMALFAVVAGVAIAPALITGSTLLHSVAPKSALSEGFSWLTSAGALSIALGTATAGRVADSSSSRQAAWVAVGGGVVALAMSIAGAAALRGIRSTPEPAGEAELAPRVPAAQI
jgi:MFS family permease